MVIASPKGHGAGELSRHENQIRNLCKNGLLDEAFKMVDSKEKQHLLVSRDIIYSLLQGCNGNKELTYAQRVRTLMRKHRLSSIAALGDHLIRLFTACGSLHEANEAFFNISKPSVFSWNSLISAHAKLADPLKALQLFEKMQKANIVPDRVTYVCMCDSCGCLGALRLGMYMHHEAIRQGFESNLVLGNALIDMYAHCGCLVEAHKLFDTQVVKDIVTWTVIISGYAAQGQGLPALRLYSEAHLNGSKPNNAMILSAIRACVCELALNEEAGKVFGALSARDVVSWSVMIDGYAHGNHSNAALQVFARMLQAGVQPNETTFLGVLRACHTIACTNVEATEEGLLIHVLIIQMGYESDKAVGNTLVDFYAKYGDLNAAYVVFNHLCNPDAVSFGALIAGYSLQGWSALALDLYDEMWKQGVLPDRATFLSLLQACSNMGAVGQGHLLHEQIVLNGLDSASFVRNALINMYAKTGKLDEARQLFGNSANYDVVSCSSIMGGYKYEGHLHSLTQLIEEMHQAGCHPDNAMLACILTACSSAGLLKEGYNLFASTYERHAMIPMQELYSSMIDLLGRAGQLQVAEDMSVTMPVPPDLITQTSLFASSKTYNNSEQCRQYFGQSGEP
ncbi:hypothetical protein GOP47_0000313 [Adiantum capillus-veneris]|uniref:Pentatricopeptide repeat-containing protein n=1 Tax=Adiantum capillus-veneris TaxID=13818 RepID=A0A9D4ZQF7_ADICA|nr:hypothetical protein GOP47_0000313 [Adiantum capillus-veneris]